MRLGSKNPHAVTQPYLCAQPIDEETKTQMKGSAGVIASVAAEWGSSSAHAFFSVRQVLDAYCVPDTR